MKFENELQNMVANNKIIIQIISSTVKIFQF